MYEVESKVEITDNEKERLVSMFKEKNLPPLTTFQKDYYIENEKSPYGGYDLKRLRDQDGLYIYTEKIWEMANGQPARKETEYEITVEEFKAKLLQYPKSIQLQKERVWFKKAYEGAELGITIDTVKFGHSPLNRYFLEVEVLVEDKNKVKETKKMIEQYVKEILKKSEIKEAPGMFAMTIENL